MSSFPDETSDRFSVYLFYDPALGGDQWVIWGPDVTGVGLGLGRVVGYGPWPLKSTGRHWHFLNSTCDMGLSDMRHGG